MVKLKDMQQSLPVNHRIHQGIHHALHTFLTSSAFPSKFSRELQTFACVIVGLFFVPPKRLLQLFFLSTLIHVHNILHVAETLADNMAYCERNLFFEGDIYCLISILNQCLRSNLCKHLNSKEERFWCLLFACKWIIGLSKLLWIIALKWFRNEMLLFTDRASRTCCIHTRERKREKERERES